MLQEFKRRHVFLAREGHSPVFRDEPEIVRMGGKEIQNAAANLFRAPGGFDRREEIQAGAAAQQREKVFLIGKTFIESRRGCATGAGNGAHGEGVLAALAQQPVRGVEDAAFQTSISLARHATTLPLTIALHYILYIVKDTMYKE